MTISDNKAGEVSLTVNVTVIAVNDAPTSVVPPDLTVDGGRIVPTITPRTFFDDEEDGASALVLSIEDPPAGALARLTLDAATGVVTAVLAPDYFGTVPLRLRARDSGGLEAATMLALVIRPVPDAPRAPATLPSPEVPADGSPVSLNVGASFRDADPGDVLRYSILSNDQPTLFSAVELNASTGELRLVWAPYVWGAATITLRGTDRDGLFADTTLAIILLPPPAPEVTLRGATRLNRQTGLIEQTVAIKNVSLRALGGFNLWVDPGPGAELYNGVSAATIGSNPPAPWLIPYHVPLAAGAEVTLVLEFYSTRRTAAPSLRGAEPINGIPREIHVGGVAVPFAVSHVLPVSGGSLLVEFSSVPGCRYQIDYSEDGTNWETSPIALRTGGTAVQWIDRGPPITRSSPQQQPVRFYRVRKL